MRAEAERLALSMLTGSGGSDATSIALEETMVKLLGGSRPHTRPLRLMTKVGAYRQARYRLGYRARGAVVSAHSLPSTLGERGSSGDGSSVGGDASRNRLVELGPPTHDELGRRGR